MTDKPQRPEDETDPVAMTKNVLTGSLGSLGLALVASVLLGLGMAAYTKLTGHEIAEWVSSGSWMVVFGGIVLGDPLSAWREGKTANVIALKMLGGMALGALISITVHFQTVSEKGSPVSFFWLMLPMLIIMPILFGSFAAKRFIENKSAPLARRTQDAAIEYLDTAGPIVMMATMGIAYLFYWLVSPSLQVTLILMFAILCGIVGYCIAVYDGSAPPITEETEDLPRSQTLREALWKNLDIATALLPAAFYMGGMIWVMMFVLDWGLDGEGLKVAQDGGVELVSLLTGIGWMTGVALVVFLAFMAVTAIFAATIFYLVSMTFGMGFSELKMRMDKFNEIVFFGAMGRSFHGSLVDRDEPPAKDNG